MHNILIELLEEHDKVSFYSIRFHGEEYTEFEKFLLKYKDTHKEDIGIIMYRLEKIIADGVFERHFRYAGKKWDRTSELPSHLDTANLRLYCICVSQSILILGNGGLKTTRTYNEDPYLNKCVDTLQKVDIILNKKQKTFAITINGKILEGELSIKIK